MERANCTETLKVGHSVVVFSSLIIGLITDFLYMVAANVLLSATGEGALARLGSRNTD